MSFLNELKRRNVLRVGTAYIVSSWLLIQVSETIFPLFGYGDTPARLIVIVLAIAFIPSLIFSWVFEITPEGLKKDADVVRDQSITHVTGKKLDRIILVVLALALAYFAFDKFVLDPTRDAELVEETTQKVRSDVLVESYGDKSIAVLPFVNMSSDPEQEYFSDGISEELLNLLSKIPKMRVISRSSAFSFKGKELDIRTIATQLNVAYILEGSVRKDDNQVRITAQLIEARSDTHLWSETYDRELVNIFKVQDEISVAIIGALKERLGLEIEAAPLRMAATNTEAHDAYLRGRYLVVQRTPATIEGAVREFEKAITLDPNYALAHAELAIATSVLSYYSDQDKNDTIVQPQLYVERALALDPKLAEAHAAKGLLLMQRNAWGEAVIALEQAIQINPSYSLVHTWMRNTLVELGRYEDAFSTNEKALILDPLSKPAISNYLQDLIATNRLGDADWELEKIATIYPDIYAVWQGALKAVGGEWAYVALGSLDALLIVPKGTIYRNALSFGLAIIGLDQEAFTVSEEVPAYVFSLLGRPLDAVSKAEEFKAKDPTYPYYSIELGRTLAAAGEYARAKPILEKMWQQYDRRITVGDSFTIAQATALIAARLKVGEEARVGELLAAIKDNVRRYREAGITRIADYEEGLAAYLSGEHERGLALLSRAAENGYFILPKEAYLQTLYDDPGFTPILANQEARQARERKRFLDIVCTDNPYVAVWQPAVGTCERFAAEGGN